MKYLGGKQRLGKYLAEPLRAIWEYAQTHGDPKLRVNGYLEPFCGSLGVFGHMTDLEGAKTCVANDYHPDLMAMWQSVQAGTFTYPDSISEKEFDAAKRRKSPDALKGFVGFGMSFGGRFFGVYAHKYLNGKKEDFCKEMTHSLQRTAPFLIKPHVRLTMGSYEQLHPQRGPEPQDALPCQAGPSQERERHASGRKAVHASISV